MDYDANESDEKFLIYLNYVLCFFFLLTLLFG